MARFEYLIVNCFVFLPPLICTWFLRPQFIKDNWKKMLISISISAAVFIIWDWFAVWRGHWAFNPKYNLGVIILNLPLEEYMFFICIPFACTLVWLMFQEVFLNFDKTVDKIKD
jgi:lycopene cyclase domain-containing protein